MNLRLSGVAARGVRQYLRCPTGPFVCLKLADEARRSPRLLPAAPNPPPAPLTSRTWSRSCKKIVKLSPSRACRSAARAPRRAHKRAPGVSPALLLSDAGPEGLAAVGVRPASLAPVDVDVADAAVE